MRLEQSNLGTWCKFKKTHYCQEKYFCNSCQIYEDEVIVIVNKT